MAHLNKVKILKSTDIAKLEDKVNTFLLEGMKDIPGFCVMNLLYQVTSIVDNRYHWSAEAHRGDMYSVVIHYVVNGDIKKFTSGVH